LSYSYAFFFSIYRVALKVNKMYDALRAIKNGQSRKTGNKTQDEDKQNKYTTQYVLDTIMRKQIHIT